jgi:Lipocalin-like domain
MSELRVARSRSARAWFFSFIAACTLVAGAVRYSEAGAERLTRDGVVGVWRLVRIEYSGPHGTTLDPFYQAGSTGLLIYDSSGWMSVDIVAPDRRSFEVPSQRLSPDEDGKLAALKAAAFDGYYAYDGTWDFDAETSELVHHVIRSLLPAESGLTYTQKVSLEGGRLVFSNRSGAKGEETLRRKIWERVGGR